MRPISIRSESERKDRHIGGCPESGAPSVCKGWLAANTSDIIGLQGELSMKKRQLLRGVALIVALVAVSDATAQPPSQQQLKSDPARAGLIDRTEAALLDQIKCQKTPQVGRAINAMLRNHLIRYADNENGVYVFKPVAPLTFLGLRVANISGFDPEEPFANVPGSTMVGMAPEGFLEIEVAAPMAELRKRALDAGLIEAVPYEDKRGFEVSASTEGLGSYLATEHSGGASSIRCVEYPLLPRRR